MPRVKRRNKARESYALTFYQVLALMVGWRDPLKYPFIPIAELGYRTEDDLRAAWELHRENLRISQWLDPEDADFRPGRRPAAWWRFDAPEPRNRLEPQEAQLERLGVLLPHEVLELERIRLRKVTEKFDAPEVEGGFLELPDPSPLLPEVQVLCEEATAKAKNETWFPWVVQENGLLSPADSEAYLKHGCMLDLERGFHACDFIETFCKQSQGEWAGQFIELADWQVRKLLLPLFGWVRPNGLRRYRDGSAWIAKKQGKSTLCSGIEIYGALGDGEGGPRIFSAAVTKEQADIVHNEAANMVRFSPEISALLEPKDSKKEICFKRGDFVIKALAADGDSNEGKHIYYLIVDELHAWQDAQFFGSLRYGNAARRQPLTFKISTAGADLDSLGGEEYNYTKKILSGELFNFSYFALVFEPPVGLDYNDPRVYMNPAIWRLANPSLGVTTSYEGFLDALTISLKSPKDWADFLRYRLNRWIGSDAPYLNMAAWYECGEETFEESRFHGLQCFSAADLSSVDDTTAVVHCFPIEDLFYFLFRVWAPSETIEEKLRSGEGRYREWADAGFLYEVDGPRIDQELVFSQLGADASVFMIEELAFDAWQADWMMQKVMVHGIDVFKFPQSYQAYSYALREFRSLCDAGRLRTGNHPVANWQASNLTVKENPNGERMPAKKMGKKKFKIDIMGAAVMAFDRALRNDGYKSIYDVQKPGDVLKAPK